MRWRPLDCLRSVRGGVSCLDGLHAASRGPEAHAGEATGREGLAAGLQGFGCVVVM